MLTHTSRVNRLDTQSPSSPLTPALATRYECFINRSRTFLFWSRHSHISCHFKALTWWLKPPWGSLVHLAQSKPREGSVVRGKKTQCLTYEGSNLVTRHSLGEDWPWLPLAEDSVHQVSPLQGLHRLHQKHRDPVLWGHINIYYLHYIHIGDRRLNMRSGLRFQTFQATKHVGGTTVPRDRLWVELGKKRNAAP